VTQLITPKQVAQAIGVSESSLKRWCDRGLLTTVRTAGGHRRLALDHVVQFLRQSGHQLVRPELLGLPSNTGQGATIVARARDQIRDLLIAGDEDQCRRIVFDLHMAGQTASEICDFVLAGAFHDIGDLWSCGDAQVYQERRACDLCLRILADLRSVTPAARDTAPLAIGGAPECDPYMLPTAMVEVTFRQLGWRAQSLGSRLPMTTLLAAVRDARPQIFWLSVSHIDDEQQFVDDYRSFYEQVGSDVAVVVGGRRLVEPLRRQMEYAAYCDSLQHLEAFAKTLKRSLAHGKESTAGIGSPKTKAPKSKRNND
jgi:excisionase family DNA binding protein